MIHTNSDPLKVSVGDRVRRRDTFLPINPAKITMVSELCINEMQGMVFLVTTVVSETAVRLELIDEEGRFARGFEIVVSLLYFTALHWEVVPPLALKLAIGQDLDFAQQMIEQNHYLHRRVHTLARPMAYLVMRGTEPMGSIFFSRAHAARVFGKRNERTIPGFPSLGRWGNLGDVQAGRCAHTQWEVVNLARFYLYPRLQDRRSQDYVPNAASFLLRQALWHVCLDYLLVYPPAFLDQPYLLRQCISYCQRERFLCTLYLASAFRLVRTNKDGMQTYARPLRGLMPHEKRQVAEASLASQWAREHRADKAFQETMAVRPILRTKQQRVQKMVA